MTASILAILGALVPFIIWLWKRHDAQEDDPRTKLQEAKHENAKTVATGSDYDVNALLDERLSRVRPQDSSAASGSGSGADASR